MMSILISDDIIANCVKFEFVGFITTNFKTAYLKKKKSKINEENKSFRLLYEDSLHQFSKFLRNHNLIYLLCMKLFYAKSSFKMIYT